MCKWSMFLIHFMWHNNIQTSSILPLISFHYILHFFTRKIMFHFLFNSQGSLAIILELSRSPEAFQSLFNCRYNSSSSLHLQFLSQLSVCQFTDRCTMLWSCFCLTSCIYLARKRCCTLEWNLMHVDA